MEIRRALHGKNGTGIPLSKSAQNGNGISLEIMGRDPQCVELYGTEMPESKITWEGNLKFSRPIPPFLNFPVRYGKLPRRVLGKVPQAHFRHGTGRERDFRPVWSRSRGRILSRSKSWKFGLSNNIKEEYVSRFTRTFQEQNIDALSVVYSTYIYLAIYYLIRATFASDYIYTI